MEATVERQQRLESLRQRATTSRELETTPEREQRLQNRRERDQLSKTEESTPQRQHRQESDRLRTARVRNLSWMGKEGSAFRYNSLIDYENDKILSLGSMSVICQFCLAKKWTNESRGMCCASGQVKLDPLQPPPEPLITLLTGEISVSHDFFKKIRSYNSVFQMTSFGGNVKHESGYMPTFRVQGQVYHRIGSLLPTAGEQPKFLQLYFVGNSQEEAELRGNLFENLREDFVSGLQAMLHEHNPYIQELKTAVETNRENPNFSIVIHADRKPVGQHPGRYNAPTTQEIAVLLVQPEISDRRDIILTPRDGTLRRIAETHRAYDCLQYPLMFSRGEDGYSFSIPLINPANNQPIINKKVSCQDFYAYRVMLRNGQVNYLLYFRSLLNQYLVDMYAKIETERLNYIRYNQATLRAEEYVHLQDAIARDGHAENAGQMIILPSSFIGGPRYMHQRTQDAMTYVRNYGRPDLFITFTCNPKWKEIEEQLFDGQKPEDRYDIISRVFRMKIKKMMHLMVKFKIFGSVKCHMYSIEWQKRGLPHVHILLWLETRITSDQVDTFISAEIPDETEDPKLFNIIKKSMIHGPCGSLNHKSPCMKEGKCTKKFPRKFVSQTQNGEDGYPTYRRRSPEDGGCSFKLTLKSGVECDIDNKWVVPYCPTLSRSFDAHINVEYCHSVKSIKYICKYVNKGTDQATFQIQEPNANRDSNNNVNDEVLMFQTGRYISSSEATWRILSFHIHERFPAVIQLQVHLENGQRVYYRTSDNIQRVLQSPKGTTLTAFFELCSNDTFAQTLMYHEVLQYYTFNQASKKFNRRRQGRLVLGQGQERIFQTETLGRVYTVHPNNAECYFLRMLLHVVRGPTSFEALRTVNGELCPTYQAACQNLGLLEDDDHWHNTLQDAALSEAPQRLRYLFAIMLSVCFISEPVLLWERNREHLSEDVLHEFRRVRNDSQVIYTNEIFENSLLKLQQLLNSLGNKKLSDFGLPQPNQPHIFQGPDIGEYNLQQLQHYVQEHEGNLNEEQQAVYSQILESVDRQLGHILFLDAPGGTGKTYLINLILNKVRSSGKVVFAVASSGIAATLLQGGKTAHSTFKLPLNLHHQEEPLCSIKRGSKIAIQLQHCALIVWNECTMSNKVAVEAVNRTLKDITGKNILMGGITVLFSGDFRQTLPVISRGTRADEVNACLKRSFIWRHITRLYLTVNMRVQLQGNNQAAEFSRILLEIGDGKLPTEDLQIKIPNQISSIVSHLDDLISKVYPQLQNLEDMTSAWYCEWAILTTKNETVAAINNLLLERCSGETRSYLSVDTTINQDEAVNFPTEFLNSLILPGLPPRQLDLKIGAPIMLLRNLDAPRLCNGTRLRVRKLQPNVIEAEIITGCSRGEIVFIPRIPIIPDDCPYNFKRLQFPVKLAFAMTINKAQGPTLSIAGADLRAPCFSHGQLYVACSRVTTPSGLFILAPGGKTSNIVYPEALS